MSSPPRNRRWRYPEGDGLSLRTAGLLGEARRGELDLSLLGPPLRSDVGGPFQYLESVL